MRFTEKTIVQAEIELFKSTQITKVPIKANAY
jgi:hypothetical protein